MSTAHRLSLRLLAAHPDAAARVLDGRQPEEVAELLAQLDPGVASSVLGRLAPALAAEVLIQLPGERAADLLAPLPPHRIARLLRRIPRERRGPLVAQLPVPVATGVRRLLSHDPGTAGSLMDPLVFALPDDLDVGAALTALREGRGSGHYLYVVDRNGKLVGVVGVTQLIAAEPTAALASVMRAQPLRLHTRDSLRAVVVHPAWTDLHALPVVDDDGTLAGALRYRTVRRLELESPTESLAPISLIASLAELYWFGLVGLTEGIATVVDRAAAHGPARATDD